MQHQYETFWDIGAYRIIDCRDCGFKHLEPLPAEDTLTEFYQNLYHKHVKAFDYNSITDEKLALRLARLDQTRPYAEVYRKVTELQRYEAAGRMLDVGCGNSILALYFQKHGWDAMGLEPGKEAAAYLRRFGLEVIEAFVEEVDRWGLQDLSFINLQFVLEHLCHPRAVLEKLFGLLKPGGILRIGVPNDFSDGQLAYADFFKVEMKWVCLPDHLNYFTFESLSRLLGEVGFKEVYRTTNFPLEWLLLGGVNYYADEAERLKVNPLVTNFENALLSTGRQPALEALYENLARLGWGRSIFMYAVKP